MHSRSLNLCFHSVQLELEFGGETHRYRFSSCFVYRKKFLFFHCIQCALFVAMCVCVCILFYAFAFMHACICSLRLHAFLLHYLNVCNALYMWYDCIYMPNRAQHNPIKNNGKKCTAIEQTILSENDLLSRVCFRAFYTLA